MGIGAGALRIIFFAALFQALSWGVPSFARAEGPTRAPIVVAVLDTPIDYSHPLLAALTDAFVMYRLRFQWANVDASWLLLNERSIEQHLARLHPEYYEDQLRFLDAATAIDGGKVSLWRSNPELIARAYNAYLLGLFKYVTSAQWRRTLRRHSRYHHGTHVAGLAVGGLPKVSLVGFPLLGGVGDYVFDLHAYDSESERKYLRAKYAQLTRGFQAAGVRVANLSFGSSYDYLLRMLTKDKPLLWKWENRKLVRSIAQTRSQVYQEELSRFFEQNPDTIFVLAAGNDGINLDRYAKKGKRDTGQISGPNVVTVGSVRGNGRWSEFSNFSAKTLTIAAPGEAAVSAIPQGQFLHMTGTSMATPMVTRRLAEILIENPLFTPEQAISELLSDRHSRAQAHLQKKVRGGRVLRDAMTCMSLLQSPKETSDGNESLDFEISVDEAS